ncbi:MAG TPA: response regulator [Nitrospiraceae bacterium]|nr:response regulator [Nitrospiraceae bacterium]
MTLERILIVDDEAHIRETVRLILERAGYNVLLAANGQEAISLMEQGDHANTVKTLLCDLDMPEINGSTLIAHFRSCYPTIPILVLSGTSAAEFTEAIAQQGVLDWIRKPATRETIIEKVRGAVKLCGLRKKDALR